MKKWVYTFFLLLYPGILPAFHPVHLSVVNIEYSAVSHKLDFSIRLSSEDLQVLINNKFNTFIDFSRQTRMTYKEQQSIIEYIKMAFVLKDPEGETIPIRFTEWKIENHAIQLFFFTKLAEEPDRIIIENRLMLELFNDQKNLVIFKDKGYEFDIHRIIDSIDI